MVDEEEKVDQHKVIIVILKLGWYLVIPLQALMVLLWISSLLSHDSSTYFKVNVICGILSFLLNYFVLKNKWKAVATNVLVRLIYIFTGILMSITLFCLPVGIFYIIFPSYLYYFQYKKRSNTNY